VDGEQEACPETMEGNVYLKAAAKERKRRRMGVSENSITRKQAEYPGHVWSYDFAMDAAEDRRRLKMMPIVEEYSREYPALETQRLITAESLW
jgi:putative transposase